MPTVRVSRRHLLKGAAITAGVAAVPRPLRAQVKTIKVGVVSPITGAMAEVGGDCRLGAQLAAEAINAAGGIKSLGGAKLELLLGDSETKVEVARSEADRLIGAGAQPDRRLPLRPRGRRLRPGPAAPGAVHDRHHRRGCDHRQHRQVGAGGAAEGPVRLPQLSGPGDVRAQRGEVHDRDLPRGGGEPEAGGRHVLQRPVRQEPVGGVRGRRQGAEPRVRDRGEHRVPGDGGRSLHRDVAGQGAQAGHHRAGHAARRPRSSCWRNWPSSAWTSWV